MLCCSLRDADCLRSGRVPAPGTGACHGNRILLFFCFDYCVFDQFESGRREPELAFDGACDGDRISVLVSVELPD
ncbi:hypothetical protein AKJ16_DCAP05789 [Drosera capensis]